MRPARSARRLALPRLGQRGATLMELVVLTAIMGMVLAGALGIYQVSQQSYTKNASLLEAQAGARNGLDRMMNELRLVGSFYSGFAGAGTAITEAMATRLTFRGDIDGDTVTAGADLVTTKEAKDNKDEIEVAGTAAQLATVFNGYADAALNDFVCIHSGWSGEVQQLKQTKADKLELTGKLVARYPAGSVVRSVETVTYAYDAAAQTLTRRLGGGATEPVVGNVVGVAFTYFDETGTMTLDPVVIREIQVSITTRGADGAQRTMTTRIKPRNLS